MVKNESFNIINIKDMLNQSFELQPPPHKLNMYRGFYKFNEVRIFFVGQKPNCFNKRSFHYVIFY